MAIHYFAQGAGIFIPALFIPFDCTSIIRRSIHSQSQRRPYTLWSRTRKNSAYRKGIQKLQKAKPIFRKQLVGDDKRFATVFRVSASPSTVWSVIKSSPNYPDWIEDIKSVDIYKREEGVVYVRFDADSRFAGENTWFARHDYPLDDREWGRGRLITIICQILMILLASGE